MINRDYRWRYGNPYQRRRHHEAIISSVAGIAGVLTFIITLAILHGIG